MVRIKTILFTDDTSVVVSSPNVTALEKNLNHVFNKISKWFNANLLSLNYSITYHTQFRSKNQIFSAMNTINNNKLVQPTTKLKFLGLFINSTISWNE
jgi:hypothetical protein